MIIKSDQFGVVLVWRGKTDPHVCFQLISEDDENWFVSNTSSSSYWLNDILKVLNDVKAILENSANFEKSRCGFGYEFVDKKNYVSIEDYNIY